MNDESTGQPAADQPSGSTGSRTEAGKAISSQNARKHDLCSRTLRLLPEERAEYNDMRDRYARDLQPVDDVEQTLVDEICFNYWRLQQARAAELTIIDRHPTALPIISLYIRYRTGYERGFYKALDKLHQAQRLRSQEAARQSAAGAPLAAAPLAAAPLAAVCSAKSSQPAATPQPAVRSATLLSAEEVAEAALNLEDRLEAHLLENRIRVKQQLHPIEMPKALASRLDHFVSQNPGALSQHLLDSVKKAA
jgi:hypothetical protein